jgi:ABC-type sugar transport system permease subunit
LKVLSGRRNTSLIILSKKGGTKLNKAHKEYMFGYLMLLPALILFFGFIAYPMISGFYISLNQWDGFSAMKFIGFGNYISIFKDDLFRLSLFHNVEYAIVSVLGKIILSLFLASLLNSKIKGLTFFRAIYFTPVVISFIAIGLMFQLFLDPTVGSLNQLLIAAHIINQPILFLADQGKALWTIITLDIWKYTGYQTVIFLAGLQTISNDLYESSDIDGASSWQKFRFITFPLLRPITIINVTLCTMGAFSVFDLVYVMTNGSGGPLNSTQVLMTYMYKVTFGETSSNMGYGSAVAFILVLIIFAISVIQSKIAQRSNI